MLRILLVEDDREVSRRLGAALDRAGFAVDRAYDGSEALFLGETQDFDAVVLDLNLPVMDGLEVLRRWRAAGRNVPVLVLSARSAWAERVEGLNLGADDYLAKPFQAAEVIARLRALLRRSAGAASPRLKHGAIELDLAAGSATLNGRPVELTARELRILGYLMHRTGRIVSQSELIDHVYAMDDTRESNTIEVYVARLRKKLGREAIKTVRGLGYRIG